MADDGQANGWDFWDKVYTNKEMRKTLNEQQQNNEVTMAELLRSTHLARAEIIVQNVPRLSPTHIQVVQDLIRKELKLSVPILGIDIVAKRWTLRFYRREDASEVLKAMSGYAFKGKTLHLTLHEVNTEVDVMEVATEEPVESARQETNPNWACAEWTQLISFKNDLVAFLQQHPDGMSIEEVLGDSSLSRRRGLLPVIVNSWPTGLFRLFLPQIRMTGRYLSLPHQENLSTLLRISIEERLPRVVLEDWEPMAPMDLRSEAEFLNYMSCFLVQFGPQHLDLSIQIRLLASIINFQWPRTSRELAHKAAELSCCFVIIDDTIYLATNVRHRRMLLDYMLPAVPANVATPSARSSR